MMKRHPQQIPLQVSIGGSQIKSLQNRNTKNLSIYINPRDNDSLIPTTTGDEVIAPTNNFKDTVVSTGSIRLRVPISTRPPLLTRKSEASIYSTALVNSYNSSSGIRKPSISHLVSSTSKTHSLHPVQLPGNHSVPLTINTQIPNSYSRNRSQTIDTSTPIFRDNSNIVETPLYPNQQLIPFIQLEQQTRNTQWIFTETTSKAGSDGSNPIYKNINVKDAYPNGPLLVIPPNIYLYSEPTLHEILDFDLIINVAEEIPNLQYMIPLEFHGKIEYHHVEWSHQSNIVKDLKKLTDIMHKATLQNKKVLIHCQCGVSRSASLMVAYIMRYFNMSLNNAYNKLKSVAKDISPNMGLIFQLMEWSEELSIINDDIVRKQGSSDNKDSCEDASNDSSVNTSLDLTPKTPLECYRDHNFTTLDI